jgi:hypothetical protein
VTTGIGGNQQGLPEDAPRAWRRWTRKAQNIAAILWPSFMAACLATGIFFGYLDPIDLSAISSALSNLSDFAVYTVGFFFFWFVCSVSSFLSVLLIRTSRRQDGSKRKDTHH